MVLTKEQFMDRVSKLVVDDNDESLKIIEDFSDTYNDMETRLADSTDWKAKYEENDKTWRERYRERFFSPIPDSKPAIEPTSGEQETVTIVDEGENVSFDDLFKEKEEE